MRLWMPIQYRRGCLTLTILLAEDTMVRGWSKLKFICVYESLGKKSVSVRQIATVWETIFPDDSDISLQAAFFRHGTILEKSPPHWKTCQVQYIPVHAVSHSCRDLPVEMRAGTCEQEFVGFLPCLTALSSRAGRNAWHQVTTWSGGSF